MTHLKIITAIVEVIALIAVSAGTASASTLEVGGAVQNSSVGLTATLASGTSLTLEETGGGFVDTCTNSELKWKTESDRKIGGATTSGFTSEEVGGEVSTMVYSNCTHTTDVDVGGTLWVRAIAGTTNGTVFSQGAEVTRTSTTFGATLNCRTGAGTDIGTLTGVNAGKATLDINAVINCGFFVPSAIQKGTYIVTSPEGLGAVS